MFSCKGYSMRPIEEEDLEMLLEWRNSEAVRFVMLMGHKITWEEHCKWFRDIRQHKKNLNFICEYQGRPFGYIGYSNCDFENRICTPGFYIGDRENLPPGAGLWIDIMSIEYAFYELNVKELRGYVLSSNLPALKMAKLVGYQMVESCTVERMGKNEPAVYVVLSKEAWETKQRIRYVK